MSLTSRDRVKRAFRAMKDIGIIEEKTKRALKKLLKVFDKNWDAIEAENYRVLADAIFEYEENEAKEKERKQSENAERGEAAEVAAGLDVPMPDETIEDEPERPLKRLRLKHQVQGTSSNGQASALKIPKPEPDEPTTGSPPQPLARHKGKQPVSSSNTMASAGITQPPSREKRVGSERPAQGLQLKEPRPEPRNGKQKQINMLITPKDEPYTDIEPLAVVHPERSNKEPSAMPENQVIQDGERLETEDGVDKGMPSNVQDDDVSDKSPVKVDIATSTLGEVKISLTSNPGTRVHMPDIEAVLKKVNENCLRSYNITDPEFCVSEVMREFCDCVVELGRIPDATPEDLRGQ